MKKTVLFVLAVVALSAWAIGANWTSHVMNANGASAQPGHKVELTYDSSAATLAVDTVYSDTIDIKGYSQLGIWYNLGNATVCDSCNDSIKIIVQTLIRGSYGNGWYKLKTDTVGLNNIDSAGDTSKVRYIDIDTFPAMSLTFRTIIKDSVILTDTATSTSLIPLWYEVLGR